MSKRERERERERVKGTINWEDLSSLKRQEDFCEKRNVIFSFFKWASFCLFPFFSTNIFCRKFVDFSGNRTQIVVVEGKHADHLTTTTAQMKFKVQIETTTAAQAISRDRSYKDFFSIKHSDWLKKLFSQSECLKRV